MFLQTPVSQRTNARADTTEEVRRQVEQQHNSNIADVDEDYQSDDSECDSSSSSSDKDEHPKGTTTQELIRAAEEAVV